MIFYCLTYFLKYKIIIFVFFFLIYKYLKKKMNLANKPSENLQNFLFSQNNDKNALNTALLKYFENFSNESRQLDSIYQLLSNGADSNVQSQNGNKQYKKSNNLL